jgi:hypothetical protein
MPQQYPDIWHDCEAAEERAWLDSWIRVDRAIAAARHTDRLVLAGWPRSSQDGPLRSLGAGW